MQNSLYNHYSIWTFAVVLLGHRFRIYIYFDQIQFTNYTSRINLPDPLPSLCFEQMTSPVQHTHSGNHNYVVKLYKKPRNRPIDRMKKEQNENKRIK